MKPKVQRDLNIVLAGAIATIVLLILDLTSGLGDGGVLLYPLIVVATFWSSRVLIPVAMSVAVLIAVTASGVLIQDERFLLMSLQSPRFMSMAAIVVLGLLAIRDVELKQLNSLYFEKILSLLKDDELDSVGVDSAKSLWERLGDRRSRFDQDLKSLKRELAVSLKQIESFNQLAPAMIHLMDENGKILTVNEYWLSTLLYDREDVEGKSITDFVVESDQNRVLSQMQEFRNVDDICNLSTSVTTSAGEVRDVFITFSKPIPINDESPNGRLVTLIDVTEERRRLEVHRDELEKGMEAHRIQTLGMLATGVAHGFNNMLQPILTFTEMALQDIPKDSHVRQDLEFVLQSAIRARELVQQVEAFSQKDEQERRAMHLGGIVRQALKLMKNSIPEKIQVLDGVKDGLPAVMASPAEMHQLMTDLVGNAVEAMADQMKGTIWVGMSSRKAEAKEVESQQLLKSDTDYVVVSVEDDGPGIKSEDLSKVFDPFFSTRKVSAGSGMGLASANGILRKLGGAIVAGNRPEGGASFFCVFPAAPIEEEKMAETTTEQVHGHEVILFVDDEPIVLHSATRLLQRMGYDVRGCESGEEALKILESEGSKYDLIITDLTMPGISGLELAARVKENHPGLPVLLATGIAKTSNDEDEADANVDAILYKPYKLQDLDSKISGILEQKREEGLKRNV